MTTRSEGVGLEVCSDFQPSQWRKKKFKICGHSQSSHEQNTSINGKMNSFRGVSYGDFDQHPNPNPSGNENGKQDKKEEQEKILHRADSEKNLRELDQRKI